VEINRQATCSGPSRRRGPARWPFSISFGEKWGAPSLLGARRLRARFFMPSLSWMPDADGEYGSVVAAVEFLVA